MTADLTALEAAAQRCKRARTDFWSHDRMDALVEAEASILKAADALAELQRKLDEAREVIEPIVTGLVFYAGEPDSAWASGMNTRLGMLRALARWLEDK